MIQTPHLWLNPTRKVSRKSGVNYRGQHISPKTGNRHMGESLNEHYYCFHVDVDQNIATYRNHPATFGYIDKYGRVRQYSPDKLLIRNDGQWIFVEIKPYVLWVKETWQAKLKYLQGLFHSIHCHFIVVLDIDIRREPRLSNLKLMNAYAGLDASPEQRHEVAEIIRAKGPLSIDTLATLVTTSDCASPLIYHLLHHNVLSFDMDSELNALTEVSLAKARI